MWGVIKIAHIVANLATEGWGCYVVAQDIYYSAVQNWQVGYTIMTVINAVNMQNKRITEFCYSSKNFFSKVATTISKAISNHDDHYL